MMEIEAGTEVGLYRIIEQLGQGGMATVFKARHKVLKRDAALKFLHPAFLEDPEFVERFRHEARMIAGLEHPNIVPVFDFAEHEGLPYLAMKFVRGETLKARLSRGGLSMEKSCRIIDAVGQGLAYAHVKGILHRDVKPSNVLMGEDAGIYLADFGIARIAASAQSTLSSEMLIGTPQYISPEQARSEPDLDERTDIYSLGIMLYELVVGHVPFDADTPISIIHDHLHTPPPRPSRSVEGVSEGVEHVIMRALAKKREDRYESAEAMVEAFLEAARATEYAEPDEVLEGPSAAEIEVSKVPTVTAPKPLVLATRPSAAALRTSEGLSFPLSGERLLIGRKDPKRGISPDVDLTLAEPEEAGRRRKTVHREQAWITWGEGEWGVEVEAGKEDRAWMNGEPMEADRRYVLQEGDHLKFGAVELEFRLAGGAGEREAVE